MKKHIIILVLVVILSVLLFACVSENGSTIPDNIPTAEADTDADPA